jgi:hypothetical protein
MTSYIDGIAVEYTTPSDIKSNGLSITHVIFIPNENFERETEDFLEAANELLVSALDTFEESSAFVPRQFAKAGDDE